MVREAGEELTDAADVAASADRYVRQKRVQGVGDAGQRQLGNARILVVGVGALGTHTAMHLARAGVGRLALFDRDVVTFDNLHRQVLFDEDDATHERPKATAAADRLAHANSEVEFDAIVDDFQPDSWARLPFRPDLVVDGTDNFGTRLLLNDLCVREGLPLLYGGAVGTTGRAAVFRADRPATGPCLRCVLPAPPPTGELPTCETAGVLAPVIAMVAAFQVAEVLKIVCGAETTAGMLEVDVWRGTYAIRMRNSWTALRSPDCSSCGTREFPALAARAAPSVQVCGRDAVQVRPTRRAGTGLDLVRLHENLRGVLPDVRIDARGFVRFAAEGFQISVFESGRALVRGTNDPLRARAVYDRYVGVD